VTIRDISQALRPALPVWPGDTRFSAERTWDHDATPVAVSRFAMSTHGGTHADAPLHYARNGEAIEAMDLDAYVGPARVVDARSAGERAAGGRVTADWLAPHLEGVPPRVLLRTFDRFPHDAWVSDFTAIAPDAIELLAARGVRLIGTDAPSIDPQESKTLDAHKAVLAAGMRILEGLVLDDVAAGDYELIALPLKLAGLDAAPVRAVLRDL